MFKSGLIALLCLGGLVLPNTVRASQSTIENADELYKKTDFDASLALLDKHSTDAATQFLIGKNYFMMSDFKKASDAFSKATQAQPKNGAYFDWLGRAWGRRAETSNPLMAPSYATRAREAFEQSVALDVRNAEALSDLFEYYLEAPGFLGGGYDKAAGVASKLSSVDPAEGYFATAQLEQKRNENAAAERHLREAIAIAPRQVGRVIELAKFLAKQGRVQESDAVFQEASKLAPNSPSVWYARADVLIKEKRNLAEARELLTKYMRAPLTVDDHSKNEAARLLKQANVNGV